MSVSRFTAFLPELWAANRAIEHDLPCAICGYNLRTLRARGLCPECGTPIRRSTLGTEINTRWYDRVKFAIDLMWWIFVSFFLLPLILPIAAIFHSVAQLAGFLLLVWSVLTVGGMAVAFWLVTQPEPPRAEDRSVPTSGWRAVARSVVTAVALTILAEFFCSFFQVGGVGRLLGLTTAFPADTEALLYGAYWFGVMWWFLYFVRVQARQISEFLLANQFTFALWCLPLLYAGSEFAWMTRFCCFGPLLSVAALFWTGSLLWLARQEF